MLRADRRSMTITTIMIIADAAVMIIITIIMNIITIIITNITITTTITTVVIADIVTVSERQKNKSARWLSNTALASSP